MVKAGNFKGLRNLSPVSQTFSRMPEKYKVVTDVYRGKKHIKTSLGCVGFIEAVWRLQTTVTAEAHIVQDYSKTESQGHKKKR